MAEDPGKPIEVSDGAAGIYLQLGAFSSLESARSVETRLGREIDWLADRLVVRSEMSLFKVQAGPWAARPEAQAAAERILRETGVQAFAVTR
jgi:rare lipoprotein A